MNFILGSITAITVVGVMGYFAGGQAAGLSIVMIAGASAARLGIDVMEITSEHGFLNRQNLLKIGLIAVVAIMAILLAWVVEMNFGSGFLESTVLE